jgi:signal peptidase
MAENRYAIYALSLFALVSPILAFFLPYAGGRILTAGLLLLCSLLSLVLIRKRKARSINRYQVLLLMTVAALVFVMLFYLAGFLFGFQKTPVILKGFRFWRVLLPTVLIILTTEIIRSVMLAQDERIATVLVYFACVMAEFFCAYSVGNIASFGSFMNLFGHALFPALFANLLYHSISRQYGMLPNIVYRLIITVYPYFLPIRASMPDAIYSFAKIALPLLTFVFIEMLYAKRHRLALKPKHRGTVIAFILSSVLMISVVMLISCQFRFAALVIGSGSMSGEIEKGDVIVYEQYDAQKLEKGQVIVFEKNDSLVIHRIIDIQFIDGQTCYFTKGDANDAPDVGFITIGDVRGVVLANLPYVGYPSIWLRDIFSNRVKGA